MPLLTKRPLILKHFNTSVYDDIGVVTKIGAPPIALTQSRFSDKKSIYVSAGNSVQFVNNANFNLGISDFTISWSEYLTAATSLGASLSVSMDPNGGSGGILFGYNYAGTGGNRLLYMSSGSGWDIANKISLGTQASCLNVWVDWELSRKGNTFYVFKNGVLIQTIVSSLPIYYNPAYSTYLGTYVGVAWIGTAYICELLVTRECLHTESFTPITEPYTFETVQMDSVHADNGFGNKNTRVVEAEKYSIMNGTRSERFFDGNIPAKLIDGDKNLRSHIGLDTSYVQNGYRNSVKEGFNEPFSITIDSNMANQIKLIVTPTSTYYGSNVNISATNIYKTSGTYCLYINNAVDIPHASEYVNIRDVSISLNLSKLVVGQNLCTLEYKYEDGSTEYIDFNVDAYSNDRSISKTNFYTYSGGFDISGNVEGILQNNVTRKISFAPSWVSLSDGLLVTTDTTSIDVSHSRGISSVYLDGDSYICRFLVSFDNRVTWNSYIDGAWIQCDPANAETQGMTKDTVNSLTVDQWNMIFKKTRLDVLVYYGASAVIMDSFGGTELDTNIWTFYTNNGGTATVANGEISLYNGSTWGNASIDTKKTFKAVDEFVLEFDYSLINVYNSNPLADGIWIVPAGTARVGTYATYQDGAYYLMGSGCASSGAIGGMSIVSGSTISVSANTHFKITIDWNTKLYKCYINGSTTPRFTAIMSDVLVETIVANGFFISLSSNDYNRYGCTFANVIMAGNPADNGLQSIAVSFMPNSAPTIANVSLTPSTLHFGNAVLSATVSDVDNDNIQYRVTVNNTDVITDWTALATGPQSILETIPFNCGPVGTNAIKIEASDGVASSTPVITYLTRSNENPSVSGVLTGKYLNAMVGDLDGDPVKYRILVNGIVKQDWSEFEAPPINIKYSVPLSDVIIGSQNLIEIEVMDSNDGTGSCLFEFVGQYYGLMFSDEAGNYYSDNVGNTINVLDLGSFFIGSSSEVQAIVLKNTTGVPLKDIIVSADGGAPQINMFAKFSLVEDVFEGTDTASIPITLGYNDTYTIYVKVYCDDKESSGNNVLKLNAVGVNFEQSF